MPAETAPIRSRFRRSLGGARDRIYALPLPGIVLLYLLVAAGLSAYDFLAEQHREFERIDSALRAGSRSLDLILGPDFHDLHDRARPVPPDEFRRITVELDRFAAELGLEYVYSMVRDGSQVVFVVSNETRDDTLRGTPSRFWNPYPSPPRALLEAFDAPEGSADRVANYTNVWDSFHSVFMARTTPAGRRYVLAADVKMKDRRAVLLRCVRRDAGLVLVLLLPLLPLVLAQKALLRSRDRLAEQERAHLQDLERMNRRLEELVADRTCDLARAVEDLRRFSFTASHDLRAPLNAVAGYAQIAREEAREFGCARLDVHLGRITEGALRMSRMIDSLLHLAANRDSQLKREALELDPLAREVLVELESGGSTFGAEVEISTGLHLEADRTLLRLLLQNLLSNACKYSRDRRPPRVRLSGGTDGNVRWFELRDNGIGFDPSLKERIFQPFSRLHGAEFEGFGIGLSHVARIVERHGWTISAESTPGEGARFRVAIPPKTDPV